MTPLKAARTRMGLSQYELADLAKIPQSTIWRVESKGIKTSTTVAAKLVPHLGGLVTVIDLLYPKGIPKTKKVRRKKAA